ncbi:MAG TPA: transcription-repair coupling factor, partial [Gammaproteobacteria bacterium]|nr:transcription-repair coupling factor [Gammaproteobacteria bacterium]
MPDRPQRLLNAPLPTLAEQHTHWGSLQGASLSLAVAQLVKDHRGFITLITPDSHSADLLTQEIRFFLAQKSAVLMQLPDWETLPYDLFSPHEDIISERLGVLQQLPLKKSGILVTPVATLMQRLAPPSYLQGHCFNINTGETLDLDTFRRQLEAAGYSHVNQVLGHGEMAIRGSLIDIFPMGSQTPFRLDLFDDEIETIRTFDPETQRSADQVQGIHLLPAHEFPLDDTGIKQFRKRYRERFHGDPQASRIYTSVSSATPIGGIEYYLPLFFDHMATLFDYLPKDTRFVHFDSLDADAHHFFSELESRHEQRGHDIERPLLSPEEIYLSPQELSHALKHSITLSRFKVEDPAVVNFSTNAIPDIRLKPRLDAPATALKSFIETHDGRILFTADSPGRREFLIDVLHPFGIKPKTVTGWHGFLSSKAQYAITVAPIEKGIRLPEDSISIVPETEILADRTRQTRKRHQPTRDSDSIIRNLSDLNIGSPVVHEDHGVGRYIGLQLLDIGGFEAEYLTLEYAGGDKLYVPVAFLHLISRYTGADADTAPTHKLGGEQWQNIKRKAAQKARDVAAELLDIYARRAARQGHAFAIEQTEYQAFCHAFPFEETDDQLTAIEAVVNDLESTRPMDRVVCGDVGFGKTEVAMRAAFVVANSGKQVAVLVPTTLLAAQHGQTFADRFSEWPFRIESLSRFRSAKEQKHILEDMANGKVDIVIGTHKLVQKDIRFKNLGLVIVDEEQRFGVRHKERLKSLRSEVDILTMTATPIPRTLNMSLSGLRDLSIIATPPVDRHAIKTFVSEWNATLITEACQREIRRGGQVYFLHNEVKTIDKAARELAELLPEASIEIAHGQMRESQ